MKLDYKKTIKADKVIYNLFRELNANDSEKYTIVGNLVKDLGFIELGEEIKSKRV